MYPFAIVHRNSGDELSIRNVGGKLWPRRPRSLVVQEEGLRTQKFAFSPALLSPLPATGKIISELVGIQLAHIEFKARVWQMEWQTALNPQGAIRHLPCSIVIGPLLS